MDCLNCSIDRKVVKDFIRYILIKICVCATIFFGIGACSHGGNSNGDNATPVADGGNDKILTLFSTHVSLDGGASRDDDGDPLSFQWELVSKPSGSSAFLSNAKSTTPFLESIDNEGLYEISLIVNDGLLDSDADVTFINVVNKAKNIILLIGDGMGFEQVRAAGIYANGNAGSLFFENFPYQGSVNTFNVSDGVTDSGAAATAMATGEKVSNGVISEQIPGDGGELLTILESAANFGGSTGLVTTTTISHATPAAFGAHETSRNSYQNIISDYINNSHPNVLFGGAQYIDRETAEGAGYFVLEDNLSLYSLNTNEVNMVWGQFGETHMPYEWDGIGIFPHLSELTETALDILDNDPDGFFLMIEGGRIDHAGHINDIQKNIFETIEFSNAAQVAFNWAQDRTDTLLIVTADHETGGLMVIANNGKGNFPEVSWGTTGHTGVEVPVYSWGVNAHLLDSTIDNTDIFMVMESSLIGG